MEQHKAAVKQIQSAIRTFYRERRKIRIYHGHSNSTRKPDFKANHLVDTSSLDHVLEINEKEYYVLVEPSVPMDKLVEATLAKGLLPPVVMEFPGITVGGGVQGGAAESSAFKWGGFHETALEYEMVLGDGRKLTVSRDKNPDLFWGTACTYGTLGIITLVKLKLIPAGQFVKLTYHKTTSHDDALNRIDELANEPLDFIDGILFSPSCGLIMSGILAEQANEPISTFTVGAMPGSTCMPRKLGASMIFTRNIYL